MLSLFTIKIAQGADFIKGLSDVDPLKGASLQTIIDRVFTWLVYFAAIVAPLIIVWGAFQILTSGGETEKVTTGKKAILYAVIGFIIMLMAKGIVDVVEKALQGK